jgi:hypothetical protein
VWVCVLIGLGAGTAHAKGEYARSGIHVSAQGMIALPTWGSQLQNQIAAVAPGSPPSKLGVSGGLDLRAGYRFHERVAAEMGFDWVADYPITLGGADAGGAGNWRYYVDVKLYLMTERIQPFALLGMGAYHLDFMPLGTPVNIGATSFSPRLGGGVDYYLTWRWGLTAEIAYVIGTRQLVNLDRLGITFGAFYRF